MGSQQLLKMHAIEYSVESPCDRNAVQSFGLLCGSQDNFVLLE